MISGLIFEIARPLMFHLSYKLPKENLGSIKDLKMEKFIP
jgi:hypothetical protein